MSTPKNTTRFAHLWQKCWRSSSSLKLLAQRLYRSDGVDILMAAPSNSFSSFSWFDGTTIALFVLFMLPQRLQLRLAVAICSLSFAFMKAVGSAVVDAVRHSTSTFELHCDDSGDTALVAALLFGHGPVFGHTCWRRWCGTETPPAAHVQKSSNNQVGGRRRKH